MGHMHARLINCTFFPSQLVFGLGRIFRLECSAIFMTEFRVRLELGAINFHLKPCMFTWAKIGSPFEVIILALYSKVSSYHLTSTEFLITTKFMISIKWSVDYTIYINFSDPSHLAFPTSNIGLRTSRHACRLVVANVTFQYPAAPLRILQFLCVMIMSHCSEGGFRNIYAASWRQQAIML